MIYKQRVEGTSSTEGRITRPGTRADAAGVAERCATAATSAHHGPCLTHSKNTNTLYPKPFFILWKMIIKLSTDSIFFLISFFTYLLYGTTALEEL